MIEEGILENTKFRQTMSDIGFATIWVTPGLDMVFDFNKGAGESFESMIKQLAEVSGYQEIATAPYVFIESFLSIIDISTIDFAIFAASIFENGKANHFFLL